MIVSGGLKCWLWIISARQLPSDPGEDQFTEFNAPHSPFQPPEVPLATKTRGQRPISHAPGLLAAASVTEKGDCHEEQ